MATETDPPSGVVPELVGDTQSGTLVKQCIFSSVCLVMVRANGVFLCSI